MKNIRLIALVICIMLASCKKENDQQAQNIPTPFYFQLLNKAGQSTLDFTNNNVKIWYNDQNGNKIYVDNVKPIKMKSGLFEYGMMSQGMPMISAFKNIKQFYIQVENDKIDSIYLDVKDLGEKMMTLIDFLQLL